MKKRPTTRSLIHDVSTAHCDLNIFYAVIALLENGLLSSNHETGVERIKAICRSESEKALKRHDALREEIERRALASPPAQLGGARE